MKLTDRQLIRAIYSFGDIQQALSALTFLLEDCDFTRKYSYVELRRFRCYESTLIISMARPFENSRNGTTLSLRSLGIQLERAETQILEKVLHLRRKIIAHSDEEEMHFRSSIFLVLDGDLNLPHLQFNEGLHFGESDLRKLECLLRRLQQDMYVFFFKLAQEEPGRLEAYQVPTQLDG